MAGWASRSWFDKSLARERPPRRACAPAGAAVRISSPDKLLFPADGITKAELAAYYAQVAPAMAPHVRDRPLNLWRWNAGSTNDVVVQQEIPRGAPDWVRRVTRPAAPRRRRLPRGRRRGGDAGLARQPELHHPARLDRAAPTGPTTRTGWCSTSIRPTRTPARTSPRSARARASSARCSASSGWPRFAMTSGSRGLHVVAPLRRRANADEARAVAGAIAELLAARMPDDADDRVAQGEARRARARRRRAQHVRADDGRALRGAGAAGRAGGDAAGLGGARGPRAAPAPLDARERAGARRRARRPVGADRRRRARRCRAPSEHERRVLVALGLVAEALAAALAVPVALPADPLLGLALEARRPALAGREQQLRTRSRTAACVASHERYAARQRVQVTRREPVTA